MNAMGKAVHSPAEGLRCKNWQTEGILRLLQNTIDPDVAEDPDHLVVYGTGKAARSKEAVAAIMQTLERLDEDETLLIQSGKPVAVFRTTEMAPRVIAVNSVVVPAYANWKQFRQLERKGLTMYGQSTASAWSYIGTQGILQGTYETFHAVARQHFQGTLAGKWVLTSGLGGMGSAQPTAIKMNQGICLIVEVDREKVARSIKYNICDVTTDHLEEAVRYVMDAKRTRTSLNVALVGNAADVYQELLRREIIPDVVTDQTSAHDLLNGYIPTEYTVEHANLIRKQVPDMYLRDAKMTVVQHVKAMLGFLKKGSIVFDYGNNIRQQAFESGLKEAFTISNFVPLYIRELQCEGLSPFRWIALSGHPADIYAIDQLLLKQLDNERVKQWIEYAQANIRFQGLPARVCWMNAKERIWLAERVNAMVAEKVLRAPVVFTRDHMDAGSMASPLRETEGMKDGSDVIGDWPILNTLLNTANGATMVSFHSGGGVGIGYSLHAGMSIVVDGSQRTAEKLPNLFLGDVGVSLVRYADAGYEIADKTAREAGLKRIQP
ncbi:urocanate hydratase [Brevibacillus sp. SYP-B805]|uniref:urocanate hydratase n=1 Tax=Brevibacillus sp. SYP-B805 TaxID=1578199 RepID=UPI0019D2D20A|nr:urocanate hydratase [Brevibacillus sp. SYP-B805]